MNKWKLIFEHTLMISTFILVIIGIEGAWFHFASDGEEIVILWYHLLSIPLAGFCSALPSLLWVGYEGKGAGFILRLLLHALLVYAIIMTMGYIFVWYDSLSGFLFVTAAFCVIYGLVWLASAWLAKQEDKRINEALKAIRDKE